MRLPAHITRELDRIPGRWRMDMGARHIHILIDDRLVAIWPKSGGHDGGRGWLNTRAQIRRAIDGRAA